MADLVRGKRRQRAVSPEIAKELDSVESEVDKEVEQEEKRLGKELEKQL